MIDIETVCNEVKSVIQSNIVAKLAEITTDKGDSLTLDAIDTDAYFFQTLNQKTVNYNPFVYYGVAAIDGDSQGGQTVTALDIFILVCISDEFQDLLIANKLFRYQRAIKEIFEETFDLPESGVRVRVQNQVPVDIRLSDSAEIHRVIGVTLRAELG